MSIQLNFISQQYKENLFAMLLPMNNILPTIAIKALMNIIIIIIQKLLYLEMISII